MLVKVCGMRDPQNIEELLRLNVDYMGLIFYEKSPRNVVKPIDMTRSNSIKRVGVFVNETEEEMLQKTVDFKLDAIQLHGSESPQKCTNLRQKGVEVIKAFSIDDSFDFEALGAYQESCDFLLFDAKGKNYGGNGVRFNWELLDEYRGKLPFLLSGGLQLEHINEAKAIRHPKFVGIDVNSGFEISPGVKNIIEIEKMLKKVKNHEQVSS